MAHSQFSFGNLGSLNCGSPYINDNDTKSVISIIDRDSVNKIFILLELQNNINIYGPVHNNQDIVLKEMLLPFFGQNYWQGEEWKYIEFEFKFKKKNNYEYKSVGSFKGWKKLSPYFHNFEMTPLKLNNKPLIKFSVENNKIIVNVRDNNINLIDAKITLHRMLDLRNYDIEFYEIDDDLFIIN